MLTGVAPRVRGGTRSTTAGVSAVARVASCARMAALRPAPSAGEPIIRRAGSPHCAHTAVSGGAVMGWRSLNTGQPRAHRNEYEGTHITINR